MNWIFIGILQCVYTDYTIVHLVNFGIYVTQFKFQAAHVFYSEVT